MQNIDQIINARWVIPVEPDNMVLDHHSIAVRDGKIVNVLPTVEAEKKYQATETITLDSHALLPGFINAHTHAAMSLFRGLADDLPLMQWLQKYIWPAEAKWVSDDFVADGTRLAMAEMLKSGTTCFNDMYFFGEDVAHIAREVRMRASVGMIMLDFPSSYAQSWDEYLDKGLRLHDDLRNSKLVSTTFAPHAPYSVADEPLKKIATLNNELSRPVHIHLHETAHEIEEAIKTTGKRPLDRLRELDLVNPNLLAVHFTQATDKEITLLAENGASVVHCPESNLKLGSGFCRVTRLLDAGVNVALGTDGAASNNDLDLLGEMRSAALLAKGVSGDATALPAHTALRMATLNGARALGLDAITGSLKKGKYADIIAIDLDSVSTQPVYDPISQIVYAANRDQITDVWIAGHPLLTGRKLATLDEKTIIDKAKQWRDKIATANLEP
ncbi:MAG: TRZ/ATZ family hydrolase [Acidiferrobacterales bacterium]